MTDSWFPEEDPPPRVHLARSGRWYPHRCALCLRPREEAGICGACAEAEERHGAFHDKHGESAPCGRGCDARLRGMQMPGDPEWGP